jgi:hypothetical protein
MSGGDEGARDGIPFRHRRLKQKLKKSPGAVFSCGVRMTIGEKGLSLFCPEDYDA